MFKRGITAAMAVFMCMVLSAGVAAQDKVTIRIMTRNAGADSLALWLDDVKKEFIKLHPNVTIQDDSLADEQAYNNKLKINIATGNVPDVFYYPAIAGLLDWAKAGVIADITPLMADKAWADGFIPGSLDIWGLDKLGVPGRFGVPNQMAPEVVWYNPDLFAKAGITKVPATIDELYTAIDKLKAAKITPWVLGGKDTWRAGHIFTNIVYRTGGVDYVRNIGARKAKWTDAPGVEALTILKNLANRGAFPKGFIGMSYDDEKAAFLSGKSAITVNGSWFLADIKAAGQMDKIKFFSFPSVAGRPQFKADSVLFPGNMLLSGKATGAEKEAAIQFIKFMTGTEMTTKMVLVGNIPGRKDMDLSSSTIDPLTRDLITYMGTIGRPGGDYSDYDTDLALLEKSRFAIQGMLVKNSPEATAKAIQAELDQFEKSKK